MASKDYYIVLGVPRTESSQGIRRAFHDLVQRHHPDRAGPDGTPAFRDVVEAYRVLSDPERRRAHDEELGATASIARTGLRRATGRRPGADVVPLDDAGLFGEPASIRPSADALLDRILRNFVDRGLAKAERSEPILCDVALSPEEARRGGVLPVRVPVLGPCPRCHGARVHAGYPCPACDARGEVASEISVPLGIPAGLRSGSILEWPLDRWGICNLHLRARVRIQP